MNDDAQTKATALERQASNAASASEAFRFYMAAAALYDDNLGNPQAALQLYLRALELDASDPGLLKRLFSLHSRTGQWADAAQVLRYQIDLAGDPDERVELSCRLGELFRRQLGDLKQARECYQEALELDSEHRPSLDALREMGGR